MPKIDELQERLQDINAQAQQVRKRAEDEQRDLSHEEMQELDGHLAAFEKCSNDIELLGKLESQTQSMLKGVGRKTAPDDPIATVDTGDGNVSLSRQAPNHDDLPSNGKLPAVPVNRYSMRGNWNFASMGDFALSVRRFCTGHFKDPRLEVSQRLAAASTYGVEGIGADGGFAVPPDFRTAIMQKVMGEDSLLSRCDQIPCSGNAFTCPKDETTPWQTSGGVLAYWDGEAATATQSKPSLESVTVKLNKLRALVPLTEELIEDAPSMDAYLRKKAPEKIGFKVNHAILNGTGVGQPLGIVNAGALVTITKESGQQADTIVGNNIIKMYAAMPAGNVGNAIWLINQNILPQLLKLALPGTDNTGNAVTGWGGLVYMPPGGLSGSPFGTLFGRPVVATQACQTLGDKGDIFFVDLSQYLAVIKSGTNPRVDVSMHLWFDQDITAFKFVLRMGGMPWWSTGIADLAGVTTYSPFVTIEAR